MLETTLVLVAVFFVFYSLRVHHFEEPEISHKFKDQVGKLWKMAHLNMRENRMIRAEKALLAILKIDKTNAAAYNRLGVLYAKQKEYKDAIECFEIASSIQPSASSLHNLGLIYLETENYEKAVTAFEQSLELDDTMAARHIAVAKALEHTGNEKLMQEHLEKAAELEPTKESYTLLINLYRKKDMQKEADQLEHKLKKMMTKKPTKTSPKPIRKYRIRRSRRIVN